MHEIVAWNELSRETVFRRYGRSIDKVMYEMPDGEETDFYIKREGLGMAVCALALTVDQEVILARQFRPGPGEILLELPGGGLDEGEAAEVAIARELLEETGYAGDVEHVVDSLDDAYSTTRRSCFVVTNCRKIAEPQHTTTEQTEVVLLPLDAFRHHLRSGQLTDIEVGYLGLDHLGLL